MRYKVEAVQLKSPSKKESEDAYVLHEEAGVFGVFDGATPLVSFEDEDGHNGAYLAAHHFRGQLQGMDANDTLIQTVEAANTRLYENMVACGVDPSKGEERWSTCVAAVKLESTHFHYAHLGDSMVIAGDKKGAVHVLTTDTVAGISDRAKKKRAEDREEGRAVQEESYYDVLLHKLQYNRRLANVPGGYTVANGMPEVMTHLDTGSYPMKDLEDIWLVSDGLFHPGLSLEETCREMKQQGIRSYINDLTAYLEKHRYPIDDRTVVHLRFT